MFLKPKILSPSGAVALEHIDGLYGYALALSRNHSDAEDLVQETYVRAIEAMGRLRPESNVKSWLFTILRNVWLNRLRKRRTAPETVDMEVDGIRGGFDVESSNDPHALYVSQVERRRVREAIQQLSVDSREIILLREYEELSYHEIATILDCPVGTVMSRLARARSRLRTLLSTGLQTSVQGGKAVIE